MADKSLIIADGHHRYETSTAYMHERAAELGVDENSEPKLGADGLTQPAFPEQAMMMTFVNMEAPGITILPTHRVVYGLPEFSGREFAEKAAQYFAVDEIPTTTDGALSGSEGLTEAIDRGEGCGFYRSDARWRLPADAKGRCDCAAARRACRSASSSWMWVQLHKVILEKLFGLNEETVRAGSHVRYVREPDEALRQVGSGNADAAFLVKPVTLEQMKDVSLNLEVMPQKSTDFYPKLLSGLAMYALD